MSFEDWQKENAELTGFDKWQQENTTLVAEPEEPPNPNKRAGEVWDMSVDLELPLADIEDDWDIITGPEVVDPATSGMGTGEGRPYPLAETFFMRPWLAAAEAAIPGARRGLLSLADAQMEKAEFTAPGGLADQIEQAPWYKKLPEAGGWAAEKYMEYKTLGFLFRATGLSSLFNTLGSKVASRIAGSQLAKQGGKHALLKYGGWNTFRTKVLSSVARTAPENIAFIATWRTTEAGRRGEPIGPAAARGALWGLGFSVAIPLVAEAAKAGMNTAAFEKVALKLQARFPKLADYLAGKPEQEFIDATIASLREEAVVAGVEVPSEITFTKLTPQAQNIIRGLARQYKKAWIKALERDAATKKYWAAGVKVAEKPPVEAIKPTEIAKKPPTKAEVVKRPPTVPKKEVRPPAVRKAPVKPAVEEAKPAKAVEKLKIRAKERVEEHGYQINQIVKLDEQTQGRIVGATSTGVQVAIIDKEGKTAGYATAFSWAKLDVLNKPAPPAAKEAWEMTREEYIDKPEGYYQTEAFKTWNKELKEHFAKTRPEYGGVAWSNFQIQPLAKAHKTAIQMAIEMGKPVPRQVLEEYKAEKWAQEALAKLPAKPTKIKPVPKEDLPSTKISKVPRPGDKEAGFVEIPPITTVGKIEAEHPNIKVVKPKKDIGVVQKWVLTATNQAQNSGHPAIIEAANTMADTGMVMHNETRSQLLADQHIYKTLPKEYRADKGVKFFELMDKYYSPEKIDAAKDIPEDVKLVLKHFKMQDESMRQEIIKQKRRMVRAILGRKNLGDLQKSARDNGIEITKVGKAGKEINRTKAELAGELAPLQVPDDWGLQWSHIQHIFFGQYELQWQEIDPETGKMISHFIGRAQTQTEAYEKLADWKLAREAAGFDDFNKVKLVATPELHLPFDVLRISRKHFHVLEKQIQEAADIERQQVEDGLRGIVGKRESKQKWWGSLMHRKGAPGYSQDFWRVWTVQVSQFNRWKHLTKMNRKISPLIDQIRSEGLRGWAEYLEETKNFLWGRKRSDTGRMLDQWLADIPVVRNYTKPFAFERWAGWIKSVNYWRHLQTGRFYVINSLQTLQTLWPVVGEKGLYRGIQLYYSKEGQDLLRKHKVAGISGKLHEIGMKRARRFERYLPAGASEIRNQGIAFLALYDDAIKRGMSESDAAHFGRLRGQLFTQFTYTQADIPKMMRGPIGGIIFQYKRFTIKNLELVSRLAREGNWGGVTRWVAALTSIGGLSVFLKALPIGLVGYLTYDIYKKIKETAGKEVADVIHHGLPGLVGIDLSGSVTPIDVPYGTNIYEKAGNVVFGPTGTTAVKMINDAKNLKVAKDIGFVPRSLKSLVDSSPTVKQFVFLAKALDKDTTNYDAKQRALYELETWDLWKKAFGFRPETESIQRMQFEAMIALKKEYDETIDHIVLAIIEGDDNASTKYLEDWNANYPESPISGEALVRRLKERTLSRELPITVRGLMDLPEPLRKLFVEEKKSVEK